MQAHAETSETVFLDFLYHARVVLRTSCPSDGRLLPGGSRGPAWFDFGVSLCSRAWDLLRRHLYLSRPARRQRAVYGPCVGCSHCFPQWSMEGRRRPPVGAEVFLCFLSLRARELPFITQWCGTRLGSCSPQARLKFPSPHLPDSSLRMNAKAVTFSL